MNFRRIALAFGLFFVCLSLGISFYFNSTAMLAAELSAQCPLTIETWLGNQPQAEAVVNEEFDHGFFALLEKAKATGLPEPELKKTLTAYVENQMPTPYQAVCLRISARAAASCHSFSANKKALANCLEASRENFEYGLGRFNRRYLDDPVLREKVEQAHLELGV